MIYYLCEDHFVTTQQQAKASGKSWKPFELPNDKKGQLDVLNELLQRSNPAPIVEAEDEPEVVSAPVIVGDECPICRRKHATARIMADSYALTDLETAIYSMSSEAYLDKVMEAVARRRAELTQQD